MRSLLARPLLALAAKWIDDTVPAEKLQRFLVRRLRDFPLSGPAGGKEHLGTGIARDLARARRLAAQAGLLPPSEDIPSIPEQDAAPAPEEIRRWAQSVPDGKVVTAQRLVAGTGRWLDWMEAANHAEYEEFVRANLEGLLRHVEIRRNRCLQPLLPPGSPETHWLEKHDVAILFARASRRRGDLRFLNAALKLNDWAFSDHRRLRPGDRTARYLLALAEQEQALAELTA